MIEMIPAEGRENVFWLIPRDADGVRCKCGGYADRVKCTQDEIDEFTCGWDSSNYECCARAFICAVCKTRITGKAAAPDF
jgi:hypothetical protein